jgi:hypothetical protein
MVASLGIAIDVAGAGVAAALIGSLMLRQSAKHPWPDAATKKCPDCAEAVLADARMCEHCGYRFAPLAESKTTEAKPRTNPPARANGLRLGDRVQVVAPGDDSQLKVGTVERILDNGDVDVKLGFGPARTPLDPTSYTAWAEEFGDTDGCRRAANTDPGGAR